MVTDIGQLQPGEADRLKANLMTAVALKDRGDVAGCIAALRVIIAGRPDYVAAHMALGEAFLRQQNWIEAAQHLGLVCLLDPDDYKAVVTLKSVCAKLGLTQSGLDLNEKSERARQRSYVGAHPFRHHFDNGVLLLESFAYQSAVPELRLALEVTPGDVPSEIALAVCHQELGESDKALALLKGAAERGAQDSWRAIIELARLSHRLTQGERDKYIAALANRATSVGDQNFDLRLAQATYQHNSEQFEAAWQFIAQVSAEAKPTRKMENFELAKHEKSLLAACQNLKVSPTPNRAALAFTPLFILGTSRSGKTTIERYLGQASGVKKGYENHLLAQSVVRANHIDSRPSSSALNELSGGLFEAFCVLYADKLREHAGADKFFTTTNPNHITDVAEILNALPQAKFVLVKRDVADTVIRMLLQSYETGNVYTLDPDWARGHVERYHQMIDIWAEKFPDQTLVVSYDNLVETPKKLLGQVLEFTGIGAENIGQIDISPFDDRGVADGYATWLDS